MRAAMLVARAEAGMDLKGLSLDQEVDADIANRDGDIHGGNPNQWADKVKNFEQFTYDADAEAEKWWREEGKKLLATTDGVSLPF
jgi:hypothetical protein